MVGERAVQLETLQALQREKAERLSALFRHKRTDKHYKKTLRAYLDADGALQQALLEALGLR